MSWQVRFLSDDPQGAIQAARPHAPYLERLWRSSAEAFDGFGGYVDNWISRLVGDQSADATASEEEILAALRRAKRHGHLLIAGGDLSGALDLSGVTHALSDMADLTLSHALAWACAAEGVSPDGLFILALGKHGARELNYSSDVDVSVFFDRDTFDGGRRSPGEAATRVVRRLVHLMEHHTGDGYVFRVDLRLRPDPRSTPPAVSTAMAEQYYESVGQNWERMAYIKARPVAGDFDAAQAFLDQLRPFIWRRHLDYWAIADIHAIKRQINRTGQFARISAVDPDLKLGPGGIREIEFFAQTQQLILGGRDTSLRLPTTLGALAALQSAGVVSAGDVERLTRAYITLRMVEHRIQMRNDEQTHSLPADQQMRQSIASLCGENDLGAFDAGIADIRSVVNAAYGELFEDEARRSLGAAQVNLVFTGVDHDPGTVETLAEMGFQAPDRVIDGIAQWHRGAFPATRTERGRELLTALVPDLLSAMAGTGEPDTAFERFSRFFEGLRSGVQTLSMLLAEPEMLADLISTLALAPKLSVTLSKRPALLESLLLDLEPAGEAFRDVPELPFEDALNAARRIHRDADFVIGYSVLKGRTGPEEAGLAHADLADATVTAMAQVAERETCRRFGDMPGTYAVCGLGKLGGRELSTGSDLDIIVLYEADPTQEAQAPAWFTRFTQSLVTALSAPTGEGLLYEVDMQLRPSGNAGPVAVKFSAFETYQRNEAWTWEHMAITRLRPIAGDLLTMARAEQITREVLGRARDLAKLRADVLDMRLRLERDRPGRGLWDLKLAPGGLVDAEFTVQHAILSAGEQAGDISKPGTLAAIKALRDAGRLTEHDAKSLQAGVRLLLHLQQILRVGTTGTFDPDSASDGLKALVARAAGCGSFAACEARLKAAKTEIASLRCEKLGPLATET